MSLHIEEVSVINCLGYPIRVGVDSRSIGSVRTRLSSGPHKYIIYLLQKVYIYVSKAWDSSARTHRHKTDKFDGTVSKQLLYVT